MVSVSYFVSRMGGGGGVSYANFCNAYRWGVEKADGKIDIYLHTACTLNSVLIIYKIMVRLSEFKE